MGRTIVVGDVHGCSAEFSLLLERLGYAQGDDRLVLVGDLVARGPDSRGAVARAREFGALAVRGNHDEKLAGFFRAVQATGRERAERESNLGPRHLSVARQLSDEQLAWLTALPLYLELPEHGALVVHAGLEPGVLLPAQDPALLMNIRSIDAHGSATARLLGTPWARAWRGPPHVLFGHDARRGLQVEPLATGLDTGCCYGRELTALVLEQGELVPTDPEARRAHLVSVPARETYCPIGNGNGPE